MSWTFGSRRVLVVIGDSYPHEPDYELNKLNIDWTQELDSLVKMGVRIYSVQVNNDPMSTSFFAKLAKDSGGQHLKLANMNTICQVIMGICYREHGAEMFHNFESELRADTQRNFGPDIEAVFGALRVKDVSSDHGTSSDQDNDATKPPHNELTPISNSSVTSLLSNRLIQNPLGKQTKAARIQEILKKGARKSNSTTSTSKGTAGPNYSRKKNTTCSAKKVRNEPSIKPKTPTSPGRKSLTKNYKRKRTDITKNLKVKRNIKSSVKAKNRKVTKKLSRPRRETIKLDDFKYSYLPWSIWQMAVSQVKPKLPGVWKTVAQRKCGAFWKKDLLDSLISKLETYPEATTIFELGLQTRHKSTMKVVYFHATNVCRRATYSILKLPWYYGMIRATREMLSSAVSKGCSVYVRFAIVAKKLKREIPSYYDYSWLTGRQIRSFNH